ncbi:MAG: dTMP kinase [Candidatus Omnitrophica bacterium]|nr:dTMP kinase [Candidatus Omnitrophota bacterium]
MFITLEGPDGGGKTTQLRLLTRALSDAGLNVYTSREPGGTPAAEAIRRLLLSGKHDLTPATEAFLYMAARAQHVRERILPELAGGAVVLCDRFVDATLAYQGFGSGLPLKDLEGMVPLAVAGRMPDLTILLDVKAGKGLSRAQGTDRMERRGKVFHERVYRGYLKLAQREPKRIRVISGQGTPAEIRDRILQTLWPFLKRRKASLNWSGSRG